MSEADNDFDQDDFRSAEGKKYDALNEQILTLLERFDKFLEQKSTNQEVHVTHKTAGMGAWGAAAVTACFFTVLMFVALLIWLVPIIHDHDAYIHRHSDQISKLLEQKK